MIIFFIIQVLGYWVQTDWSGNQGESLWVDTNSYYISRNMDGKIIRGELLLSTPSGEWESFTLPSPAKQTNAIVEREPGVLYVGCGWDSARVFKFANFGNTFISKTNLGAGEVLSLLVVPNTTFIIDTLILVGISTGKLYIGKDTVWQSVASFTAPILELYKPTIGWIYLGTADGKIWISKTEGWSWIPAESSPANAQKVFDIFESSNGKLYSCTQSVGGGRLFWSHDDGEHWDSLYTFPSTEAVYSICETSDHNLYVSTGYQGKIFTSSDSGKHWQELNSPWATAKFYHIFSDSNDILYVGGKCTAKGKVPKGMIFMSKDRCQTWDTLFCSDGWRPSEIFALMQCKSGIMFAGGDTTAVFRSGYCNSGWLESSIYDVFDSQPVINRSLKFGLIHFIGSGVIGVRVRSSFTLDSLPAWGDLVPNGSNPVNYGSAHDRDRFIQYRIEFTSSAPLSTPVLDEISLKYEIDVAGPVIDSAVAFDGDSADTSIDIDDYVIMWFDEPTNTPWIETSNIDEVLRLSNNHSWRSDSGRGIIKYPGQWITPSILKIYLSNIRVGEGPGYPPTIAVGDTIYPDSVTIQDKWGSPCFSPCIIKGGFGIEENAKRRTQNSKIEIAPNPFIHKTDIKYQVATKSKVSLRVYDVGGRLLKTLVDEEKPAGLYIIEFHRIGSGIYFVKLKVGEEIFVHKLINFNR